MSSTNMEVTNTKYVNVFYGTGTSVRPKKGSLFSKWNLLKGKAGNTSPAACLPFGSVSCAPYSGGYSSGYGNHKLNCGENVRKCFRGNKLYGFSHFTHDGVGGIGLYYNYLVATPYVEKLDAIRHLQKIDDEIATPGFYSCRLLKENIKCEITVGDKVAIHRYTSIKNAPVNIYIDISNNGLRQKEKFLSSKSTETKITLHDKGQIGGFVTMEGVKIYFFIRCSDENANSHICLKNNCLTERELYVQGDENYGCIIETSLTSAEMKIGFSLVSEENARESVLRSGTFEQTKTAAEKSWDEKLNAIQLYGITDKERELFYSNFYHTLTKPCGWNKESFLWREEETFFVDFSTLWDIYKTQIPLIFTLYKDVGRGIIRTLLRYAKEKHCLFNTLLLSQDMNIESQQACCLGCYVLYDGYIRGLIEENEIDEMFFAVKSEIGLYESAIKTQTIEKTTKLLDVCLTARAFATIAKSLGRTKEEIYFSEIANYWTDAFDENGLLKSEYPYYEGNHWNYSFRFVCDVNKRIEIAGGKERLCKQLDAFFGFTDDTSMKNRFEGFNNETDMETPYFYHYVGRYDRLSKIIDECISNCFKIGRNGLPGNNDSGGLSGCYIWNFLGLFPISGQNEFFLGVPKAEKAVLRLSTGKELTVRSIGEGKEIEKATFNGKIIEGYTISVADVLQGGELAYYKK